MNRAVYALLFDPRKGSDAEAQDRIDRRSISVTLGLRSGQLETKLCTLSPTAKVRLLCIRSWEKTDE